MAGKRHFGTMDHMIHNKLSRLQMGPQGSTACFGMATPQDLRSCQNFMNYSVPDTEGHCSTSPWSSTASYLQYSGSALNDPLQTSGASVKYQRPQAERLYNPLQLSNNPNNQASVHQSPPVHNYHMSWPRACPPIAMPRPVYRSPSSYMDAAYGSRGFQSVDVCVPSQPLCPPAVEWSPSARFAHSSSPLCASRTKKHLSTPSTYPEVAGSPSSLSQGLEGSPIYRQRADMSLAVGVSSTFSQKDIFTDTCHSAAQENVQFLYAEDNVPVGRQRSSAFTTPSPQHNHKHSAYEGSLDHRMGHLYSKNPYSNVHQRSPPTSCSMDVTGSPHNVRGTSVYPNRVPHMHSGYVNAELRVQTSHLDGTLQPSERQFQVNPSTQKCITEIAVCSTQRDHNVWVPSGQVNRDICGMPNRTDKDMFNLTPTNSSLQERTVYQDPFTGQNVNASFVQQSSSTFIAPGVSSHEQISGQCSSRHLVTQEASSLQSAIHSFGDRRLPGVRTVENATTSHSSKSHLNLEHAKSSVTSPSSVSGVSSPYQLNHNHVRSRQNAAASRSPICELPGNNMVDVDGPKSAPTFVDEDVNIDNPKSPPMPVINDVFSLAPYRAYLEGKAPHPFPAHHESEVENIASTSDFLLSEDQTEEGISSVPKVIHANNNIKIKNGECVQIGEPKVPKQNTGVESVVLDLSLKKLPQTGSSPCSQQDFSCNKDALLTVAAENCLVRSGMQIQGQVDNMSSNSSRISHLAQESFSSKASSRMVGSHQQSCPSFSIDQIASSSQDSTLSNKNVFCQQQKNILSQTSKALSQQLQENCQSGATETHDHNFRESLMYLTTKSLSNPHQEHDNSQDTERLPRQHQKNSPLEIIERLPQQLQKNRISQDSKSISHDCQDRYKSPSSKSMSHQPQYNCSSQVPENLPQQDLSSCTTQILRTLPVHTLAHCSPNRSDFSVFVNTMQTQTTILPVMRASPPTVYFTNSIALHTSQPPSIETPGQSIERTGQITRNPLESCHSRSSSSSSENECNGFHSSKSFMFRKYKMKKLSEEETHVQSLPPSAPESSPALGETNASSIDVGEPALSSGQQFSELHRSVHKAITSCVARSPSSLLEDWLSKTKDEDRSQTTVKTKNSFRLTDQSTDLPGHDIWLAFDGVCLLLNKLLSQLKTFMLTQKCPFPHVIRAGAIFIPIYLVKEVLFPELLGPAVDKILQKHKVELRPTTLSEEKLLREAKLKDCPCRMLKLLALKQLPDVYPDLLCLFCRHIIQQELDKSIQSLAKEDLKLTDSSKKKSHSASPRKGKRSLILKLKRVRKHSGISVYKTQNSKTPQKKDKLQKSPVCRKKLYRARPVFTYKKRRSLRTSKSFPNLVGRRILHLFDDGEQEVWFRGKVLQVHRCSHDLRDTQFEVWYDDEPGTRYILELLQDYEKGWLRLDD
ncbi:uncharacterized protein C15orf39 homolog [Rhinoderma darwinii]|uniref:uncharacterized protein C15orf39 homolog n=1 Tax=Rhinoderma darwinii TaxID=43563 RepID=UPI003F66EEE1